MAKNKTKFRTGKQIKTDISKAEVRALVTARVRPEIIERLQEEAKKSGLSLSRFIEAVLADYVSWLK